jgi:bacteriocin-like protein
MNKKISGNDSKIKQQDSKKPGTTELQDDDLQQVVGGLAAGHAAVAVDPVCISKL